MKAADVLKKFGAMFILWGIVIAFSLLRPSFLTVDSLINIGKQISVLGIVSIGVTFVMISGEVDVSVGAQLALIGVLGAHFMARCRIDPVTTVLLCLVIGSLLGMANGFIVVKLRVNSLLVTLGTMTIFKGCSYIVNEGLPIFGFPTAFSGIAQGSLWGIPIPVLALVLMALLGGFVLRKTYFGRYIYALGGNEAATRLAGINTSTLKIFVYTLCGLFTAVAGVIMLARINSGQVATGSGLEFDALTAAVIGGVRIKGGEGRLSGVLVGVLVIGVLGSGMNLSDYYEEVIKGASLLFAVGYDSYRLGGISGV